MKHILITTIAAVLLVGCGESQQSAPSPEAKAVEPVAEATQPEPPTAKAPDISIWVAAKAGEIEAVKQHLAAGADVDAKDKYGRTPLHLSPASGHKEIAELLIVKGADVNFKDEYGDTPLHWAVRGENRAGFNLPKGSVELLIVNGADVNAKDGAGKTPQDRAIKFFKSETAGSTADLLRKHGGKTAEELKAEGK